MQEELEKGQTFVAPVVNVLHEAAEAARTNSTYVLGRLAGTTLTLHYITYVMPLRGESVYVCLV
jgi:hypothetical protein